MVQDKSRQYLETQIQTASKEQLLLLLYDGAIRFCEKAIEAMSVKDIEGTHNALVRAQGILTELMCALDRKVDEQFASRLSALYNFLFLRLVEANLRKEPQHVEEVLAILKPLRDAWREAVEKNRKGRERFPSQEPLPVKPVAALNLQG